jgi:hypothetical protein
MEQAEKDLETLASKPIDPPSAIVDEESLDLVKKCLTRIQRRRNKILAMYLACLRPYTLGRAVLEAIRSVICSDEAVSCLRNESIRSGAVRQVIGNVDLTLARLKAVVDGIDTVRWALKENQEALVAQIGIWRTEVREESAS